ncbi:hypothetical protein VXQ18_13955 [Brucella abortus]|nr:hypothetical protein [Brucella abortus]
MRTLYEGLVCIIEDGTVKPLLAESWTISDDKKTYEVQAASRCEVS